MQILNIDGTDVEVMSYLWTLNDLDVDSGRNLAGYMERNLLEHSVNTLTIIFPPQNQFERQKTLVMLHKEELICKFLSPYSNSIETHKMMHGDLESKLYWNVKKQDGIDEILYEQFQVKLVEY